MRRAKAKAPSPLRIGKDPLRRRQSAGLAVLFALLAGCADSGPPVGTIGHVTTYFGGAAAEEPRAALAARDALSAGGTAADAAVAMYFTLAVTMPSAAGLGGGGVCVVYDRTTNTAEMLDFLPHAPAARAPAGRWPAAVPGTVRGMFALNARYGRLRWEQLVLPAESMARFGVPAPRALVRSLAGAPILQDPLARQDFGGSGGQGLRETDMLRRLDLAATLGRLRTGGAGDLYTGGLARAYVEGIAAMGGWVTIDDLRDYRPEWRHTLEARFGNHRVHFPAPPVRGGQVAATIWSRFGGDSDFAKIDPEARTRLVAAAQEAYAGTRPQPDAAGGSLGFLAMDRNGQAVSCVVTMNRAFGHGRMIPEVGFLAVEAPRDASAAPLGLVPVVISNHNSTQPFMAATGAGDGFAPVALVTAMLHATAGMPVAQALAAPRAAPGGSGSGPVVESQAPAALKAALPGAREVPAIGRVLMMYCPDGMTIGWSSCTAAVDPRGYGYAVNAER